MSSNPAQYAFEGRKTNNNRAKHRDDDGENDDDDDEGGNVVGCIVASVWSPTSSRIALRGAVSSASPERVVA